MPKDYGPILYHRESIEPHPHSEVVFTIILVAILLVQLDRGYMDHNKLPTVHLKFNIEGQVVQIFKYLLPDSFFNVFQVIVSYLTAVSIPQCLLTGIVILGPLLVFRWLVIEGIEHH